MLTLESAVQKISYQAKMYIQRCSLVSMFYNAYTYIKPVSNNKVIIKYRHIIEYSIFNCLLRTCYDRNIIW